MTKLLQFRALPPVFSRIATSVRFGDSLRNVGPVLEVK
jgi:hypothetical protein